MVAKADLGWPWLGGLGHAGLGWDDLGQAALAGLGWDDLGQAGLDKFILHAFAINACILPHKTSF